MPVAVLPVSVKIAREALLAQSSLTTIVASRVHWAIPGESPTWPLIVLEHVDSTEDGPAAQLARVQAACWGAGNTPADLEACIALANTLVSVHRDLIGSWPSGDISDASTGSVISSADQKTGRVRLIVDLLLTVYP